MRLLGRRRAGPDQLGLAPLPLAPYDVAAGVPQWAPIPTTPPWVQVGKYGTPIPTQQGGYWPDRQLKCGVEGIVRDYMVLTAADVPYFQQTSYPVDPRRNLLDGRRPGNALGVAGVANLLGGVRKARAAAEQGLAANIAGW